eukprot:CAMPEP_0117673368 /NCGR_PEP_ID=MMETSP0804-20121206/14432_1 /TAXON_ID=1074897 /ORGANISM="Tetraselmis astigmatica, Strain CCMP880" /LENGTH=264 /DNA_ID=CAMNT_0005482095 /DNA_START=76 /DNA_END=870 /DNA_ORIENTATION=-
MAAASVSSRIQLLVRSGWSVSALGQTRHLKSMPRPLPPVTEQDIEELNDEINTFFGEPKPDAMSSQQVVYQEAAGQDCKPLTFASQEHTRRGASSQQSLDAAEAGSSLLSHVDAEGRASMVDVGTKPSSIRMATASGLVVLGREAFGLVKANQMKKGDVLSISQLAGIMGAKATSQLIPLCHNIFISSVSVQLELDDSLYAVRIRSTAKTVGQTGVEMEALTATSVAALTVYDMCKAVSKDIVIQDIMLVHKSGGNSGNFTKEM